MADIQLNEKDYEEIEESFERIKSKTNERTAKRKVGHSIKLFLLYRTKYLYKLLSLQ